MVFKDSYYLGEFMTYRSQSIEAILSFETFFFFFFSTNSSTTDASPISHVRRRWVLSNSLLAHTFWYSLSVLLTHIFSFVPSDEPSLPSSAAPATSFPTLMQFTSGKFSLGPTNSLFNFQAQGVWLHDLFDH